MLIFGFCYTCWVVFLGEFFSINCVGTTFFVCLVFWNVRSSILLRLTLTLQRHWKIWTENGNWKWTILHNWAIGWHLLGKVNGCFFYFFVKCNDIMDELGYFLGIFVDRFRHSRYVKVIFKHLVATIINFPFLCKRIPFWSEGFLCQCSWFSAYVNFCFFPTWHLQYSVFFSPFCPI